ncbi:MAG: GntR family transcriptional regulator [Muribaculaceae bacterium]|nr:GntR family transcriptional regulator [Muribaculaceae bacterium]
MEFADKSKPIYLQIADRICDEITSGTFPPESRIPSVREYAGILQVNFNTVMRTFEFLSSKGIIFNKRGVGYFVSPDAHDCIARLREQTFFGDELKYFFSRLRTIGVSADRLHQLYYNYYQEHKQ